MRVLVTRPLPDARTTAARLRRLGHDVVCAPLIEIVPVAHRIDAAGVQALVVTSANAIRALDEETTGRLLGLPVYAVGGRTAAAVRSAGFGKVIEAGPDAEALAAVLTGLTTDAGPVLHLSGREVARDLEALVAGGPTIRREIVYDAMALKTLPNEIAAELSARRIDAVLHFSPRSARIFGRLITSARLDRAAAGLMHLAMSPRVADALRESGLPVAAVASDPTEAALIESLGTASRDSAR